MPESPPPPAWPGPGRGAFTEEDIRRLVTGFYARIRNDPELAPFFEDRLAGRWEAHLDRMCDFWGSVLMGTRSFRGDPLGRHAGLPGLEPRHFDRWIRLFDATARELLPETLATNVVWRARRMRVALEGAACAGEGPAHPDGRTARPGENTVSHAG